MQDQAFLGPESGLAVPAEDGGVDLFVATQWLHVDREQIAPSLGLPPDKVRLTLSGVGGAFGAREDLSMQIHAVPARPAHRPAREDRLRPRGVVLRPRAPASGDAAVRARRHPRRAARLRQGRDHPGRRRVLLLHPGGRRQRRVARRRAVRGGRTSRSTPTASTPTTRRAARCAASARCRRASPTSRRWTGSPRRAGSTRSRSACATRCRRGRACRPGRSSTCPRRSPRCCAGRRRSRCPPPADTGDLRNLPGGVSNTTHGEGVVRGVGYGIGIKNICYSEGFDDHLHRAGAPGGDRRRARPCWCTPPPPRSGRASSRCRRRSRVPSWASSRSTVAPADTAVGSAGSSSASRQSYMTGGAVRTACEAVRERVLAPRRDARRDPVRRPRSSRDGVTVPLAEVLGDRVIEETREFHHRPHDAPRPGDRPGRLPRAVRVLRPPRGRRRRRRARPRQGGRAGRRAGRRQDPQPDRAGGADPRRQRAGPRPRADGGDPGHGTGGSATPRSPTT